MVRTVLAFPAHPDDEAHAAAGLRVFAAGPVNPFLREEWLQIASGAMPSDEAELALWLTA